MKHVHPSLAIAALWVALSTAGCAATISTGATVQTSAPPTLVAIDGGVWVVADYPQSVFYYGNAYYMWSGGGWYRSSYVNSGWVSVELNAVPAHVRRIREPRRYVHYHAPRGARTRAVPARHVHPEPRGRAEGQRGDHPPRGRAEGQRGDHPPRGRAEEQRGDHPPRGHAEEPRGDRAPRGRAEEPRGDRAPRGRAEGHRDDGPHGRDRGHGHDGRAEEAPRGRGHGH